MAAGDGKIGRQHGRRGLCKHCLELSPLCRLNLNRLPAGFSTGLLSFQAAAEFSTRHRSLTVCLSGSVFIHPLLYACMRVHVSMCVCVSDPRASQRIQFRVQPSVHAPASGSIHFDLCTYIHIHARGGCLYVRRGRVHDQASEVRADVQGHEVNVHGSRMGNRGVSASRYICSGHVNARCSSALCAPLMAA